MTGRARARRLVRVVLLVGGLVALSATPAVALHKAGHLEPQGPAADRFADDVPRLTDHEWGFPIGGFGGIERGHPRRHLPVIFVHGNNTDHADWYLVRDDFLAAGWNEQELWALSYNGLGCAIGDGTGGRPNPRREQEHAELGSDGVCRITDNTTNVPDLLDLIDVVLDHTGSDRFVLVGHSLGVTLGRAALKERPELRERLAGFVAIAGANHGTSLCPPGSALALMSCDELEVGSAWLEALNGPDGEDETYPPASWLVVLEGTGTSDNAFLTPVYADSPLLEGAEVARYPGLSHNELRTAEHVVADYRVWIEAIATLPEPAADPDPPETADGTSAPTYERTPSPDGTDVAGADASGADAPGAQEPLPVTGGGALAGVLGLVAVAAAARLRATGGA